MEADARIFRLADGADGTNAWNGCGHCDNCSLRPPSVRAPESMAKPDFIDLLFIHSQGRQREESRIRPGDVVKLPARTERSRSRPSKETKSSSACPAARPENLNGSGSSDRSAGPWSAEHRSVCNPVREWRRELFSSRIFPNRFLIGLKPRTGRLNTNRKTPNAPRSKGPPFSI